MTFFRDFFMLSLSAIVAQNIFFTRALGSSRMLILMRNTRSAIKYGLVLTWVTTAGSALSFLVWRLLSEHLTGVYMRPIVFLACIYALFGLTYLVVKKQMPGLFHALAELAPSAFFSCAALGTLLINSYQGHTLAKSLGFGLGSGIGFTLALLIVELGLRRIALSDVPKAFRGLPIALLYVGLISLAIYGLTGHQLPS